MFLELMTEHTDRLAEICPTIDKVLDALEARHAALSKPQALLLAALVLERKPALILDLGSGRGASSAVFAMAAAGLPTRIATFDINDEMNAYIEPRLSGIDRSQWSAIGAYVVDIETFDFSQVVGDAESALVFWDAHGHGVARGVLGTIMPLIADKPHIVLCHDMEDNRMSNAAGSYGGKTPWSGMDDWYASPDTRARFNINWTVTCVDQIIPIVDFCVRNKIDFHSVDEDIHIDGDRSMLDNISSKFGFPHYETYGIGWFSLEQSSLRHFPAHRWSALAKAEDQ